MLPESFTDNMLNNFKNMMDLILPAYAIALALLSGNSSRFENTEPLKRAWGWLAFAFIAMAVLTVSRAGFNVDIFGGKRELTVLAIWTQAAIWLLVGISAAQLPALFKLGGDSSEDGSSGGDS